MYKYAITIILLAFVSGCAIWKIGEDPKGKEYRVQANALIDCLIKYKNSNGELPPSLNSLVPKYINNLPEVVRHSHYYKDKRLLIYDYQPTWPTFGRTSCSTVIGSGKWSCQGYV